MKSILVLVFLFNIFTGDSFVPKMARYNLALTKTGKFIDSFLSVSRVNFDTSLNSKTGGRLYPSKSKFTSKRSSKADMSRTVDKVVAACNGLGSVNSITEINHAITWASRLNRLDDAILIFNSIYELGYTPDLMSYNNIIWSVGNLKRLDISKRFFQQLLKTKLKPNIYTYGALLHACAKSSNYQMAIYYLNITLNDHTVAPNLIIFTSAMEACAECGQYKEALKIMRRMRDTGIQPDLTMVNSAIKACCLGGAMEEAEQFAESLSSLHMTKDLFTYHTLMMGHTKLGRNHRVLGLYEEALYSGTQLDGGIYSLAMLAALNSQQYTMVPRIAESARIVSVTLTEAAYTILMQAYGEMGAAEQAISCLDEMIRDGLKPNVISYAAAMSACKLYPEKVLSLLERAKQNNITPNTVFLTSAMDSLARVGGRYSDIAISMLKHMESTGPEPNIFTYNTIIRAFSDSGRLEDALEILNTIIRKGLHPDRYTFTSLLLACGRSEDVCSDQVTLVMSKMKTAGVIADDIAYGAAIDAYRRGGSPLKAIECLHEMHKNKLEPTVAHYNLVLRALKEKSLTDMMFKMVMGLAGKEGSNYVNANSFELTLEALLLERRWRESLLLLRSMKSLQFKPSIQSCVRLVELLESERQYKAALSLYRLMVQEGIDFYENDLLNDVFKRLIRAVSGTVSADISFAAKGVEPEVPKRLLTTESNTNSISNNIYKNLTDLSSDMLNMNQST